MKGMVNTTTVLWAAGLIAGLLLARQAFRDQFGSALTESLKDGSSFAAFPESEPVETNFEITSQPVHTNFNFND